jgi:hypothetical protein
MTAALPAPDLYGPVETFASGLMRGDKPDEVWDYTPEHVEEIKRNFALLSTGENPQLQVPVTETHDGKHAHSWVKDVDIVPDADLSGHVRLRTKWEKPSDYLSAAIKGGKLRTISAELKKDFLKRDGTTVPGWYLYRVTVNGSDVPRVKGLKGLPELPRHFTDDPPGRKIDRLFKFTDPGNIMDRTQALDLLKQKGVDTAGITDAVPDATVISMAGAFKGTPVGEPVKFADIQAQVKAFVRESADAELKRIAEAGDRERKAREDREAEERVSTVRSFCDRAAKENKISAGDNDEKNQTSVRSRLVRQARDAQPVRKFTDAKNNTVEKTELQLQMDEIEAREPRRFTEKVGAGSAAGTKTYDERLNERLKARYAEPAKN